MDEALEVLKILRPILDSVGHGALTDTEREAIHTAESLLHLVVPGDLAQILKLIPVSALARLIVSWRKVIATVDHGVFVVDKLGSGVKIEALD